MSKWMLHAYSAILSFEPNDQLGECQPFGLNLLTHPGRRYSVCTNRNIGIGEGECLPKATNF